MPAGTPERYVLDSYALISFFGGEAGCGHVAGLLRRAEKEECELLLSVVNLGEIAYIVERERGFSQAQTVIARIDELEIDIVSTDRTLALSAAHIKAGHSIAYADCFAAALAIEEGAALVTGDPEFKEVERDTTLKVNWLD